MAQDAQARPGYLQFGTVAATAMIGIALIGAIGLHRNAPQAALEIETTDIVEPVTPRDDWSAEFAIQAPQRRAVSGTLGRGETLSDLLIELGASPGEAHRALNPLFAAELVDPRRVRPGLSATLTMEPGEDGMGNDRLIGLSLRSASDHSFLVTRDQNGDFNATRMNARLTPQAIRVAGTVETSLYEAATADGAGDQQIVDFAKIFAYDVDFQREIHPGDRFEIVYESLVDERGTPVRMGQVIFASLEGRAIERDFYFYTPGDDEVSDYFDTNGDSATKFLMKTPINGARLSSHFGNRRHPISGYNRLHRGTDFAARSGTPVYAAGHGTIERSSRYGGYGNYVRIRHANGYQTAYAHLSRYGPGIRSGRSVRQGDVIGYVGSTGASTGPHLHYEVLINGTHVNAMNLNFPTGRKLSETPDIMDAFIAHRREIDDIRRDLGADIEIAGVEISQDG